MSRLWLAYRLGDAGVRALLREDAAAIGDGLMEEWCVTNIAQVKPRSRVKLERCVSPELYDTHAERILRVLRWGATIATQEERMAAAKRREKASMSEPIQDALDRSKARHMRREERRPAPARGGGQRAPEPVRHVEPTAEQRTPKPIPGRAEVPSDERRLYAWRDSAARSKGRMPEEFLPEVMMRALLDHRPSHPTEIFPYVGSLEGLNKIYILIDAINAMRAS